MDLEKARIFIEKQKNISITNKKLGDALHMKAPNISRKLSGCTPLKQKQIILLEEYFNVKLPVCKESKKGLNTLKEYQDLKNIIIMVEEYLIENSSFLSPDKKAALITTIYKLYMDGELVNIKKDNIMNLCKLIS